MISNLSTRNYNLSEQLKQCLCRLLHNTVIPCIGEIGVWILEIDPNRTAEIGDTMGDRFIADRVSWFGCPANAEAEIKKSAA